MFFLVGGYVADLAISLDGLPPCQFEGNLHNHKIGQDNEERYECFCCVHLFYLDQI